MHNNSLPDLSTQTVEQLEQLRTNEKETIERIRVHLEFPTRTHKDGKPYTEQEYQDWKINARYALACARGRHAQIQTVLNKLYREARSPKDLRTPDSLIRAAFQILDRIELDEDELPVRHALHKYLKEVVTLKSLEGKTGLAAEAAVVEAIVAF